MNARTLFVLAALLSRFAEAAPEVATPASGSAEVSWRLDPPPLGPSPQLVLPTFEKAVLENGLTVLVARLDRLPLVAFQLVTKGGAALDPADAHGLGNLTYGMLDEGAGALDALAFSDALADLGASFSAACGRDRGSASISGLSRHGEALAQLLADAVLRPRMEPASFARLKARTAAGIQARLGSPQGMAFLKLPPLLYGADHPLGHPPSGTLTSVKGITLEAVRAQRGRILDPKRSAFVAVGDVTLASATALARKHFGSWTAPEAPPLEIPPVAARERESILFIDKPASPQTMVVLGRPLFGRGHAQEQALTLANGAWGGSFSSRLNMNLREEKGYTYGAGSQVSFRNSVGVFVAYAALQRVFSAPGLKEFFVELTDLETKPLDDDEVERVRTGLVRSLPGDFEGVGSLAGAAAQIFAYDLPLDHYAQLAARIEATTGEEVRAAAGAYLDPGVMQVLLVGDAKTVIPALEGLGFAPIQLVEP